MILHLFSNCFVLKKNRNKYNFYVLFFLCSKCLTVMKLFLVVEQRDLNLKAADSTVS